MPSRCGTPGGAGSSVPWIPVGVRPFYYALAGERFVFASAVEAVLAVSGVSDALDEAVVAAYLTSPPLDDDPYVLRGGAQAPSRPHLTAEANGASGRVRATRRPSRKGKRSGWRIRARAGDDRAVLATRAGTMGAVRLGRHLRGGVPGALRTGGGRPPARLRSGGRARERGPGFVQRGGARRPCSAAPGPSAPARLQLIPDPALQAHFSLDSPSLRAHVSLDKTGAWIRDNEPETGRNRLPRCSRRGGPETRGFA